MAEDVAAGPAAPPAAERPDSSRVGRAHTPAYYLRFSLAYTLLIMLAVGGVAALVVVLLRPDGVRRQAWSRFVPTGSPIAMERQIATQVSSEYKASTARRLVTVFPGPLESTQYVQTDSGPTSIEVAISSVAVAPIVSTGKHEENDYTFFASGSTVGYEMCGIGASQRNCGVEAQTGTSPVRLLHRETLELALYTLKYVPGTDAVVTYLPPPANSQAAGKAVLVARKDVQQDLRIPLTRTLTPQKVFLGAAIPDAAHVQELIRSRVYKTAYQTLPGNGTSVLVLTPASAAG